jgi:hypothetical protein
MAELAIQAHANSHVMAGLYPAIRSRAKCLVVFPWMATSVGGHDALMGGLTPSKFADLQLPDTWPDPRLREDDGCFLASDWPGTARCSHRVGRDDKMREERRCALARIKPVESADQICHPGRTEAKPKIDPGPGAHQPSDAAWYVLMRNCAQKSGGEAMPRRRYSNSYVNRLR